MDLNVKSGTAKIWRNTGGDYALSFASLANNAARQGVKGDLGTPRAEKWKVDVELEWSVAPTAGNTVEVYWSPSPNATAGTQNDGGTSGTDAAYQAGNEDAYAKQLQLIGVFVCVAAAAVQKQSFVFQPDHRYGQLVIINKSAQALKNTETNQLITLTPIIGDAN